MILNFYYLFVVSSIYFIKFCAWCLSEILGEIFSRSSFNNNNFMGPWLTKLCKCLGKCVYRSCRTGELIEWQGARGGIVFWTMWTQEKNTTTTVKFDHLIETSIVSTYEAILLCDEATIRTSSFHIVVIVDNPFTWPLNIFVWLATEISYQMPRVTNRISLVLKTTGKEGKNI